MDIIYAKIVETAIAFFILLILGWHILLTSKKSVLRNRVLQYIGAVHLYYFSYLITLFRDDFIGHNHIALHYLSEGLKYSSIIAMTSFTFVSMQYLLHCRLFSLPVTELITMLPCLISVILYATSPITHLLIYIDNDYNHIRGPLYMFPYIFSLLYFILSFILIGKSIKRNHDINEKKFAFMLIIFIMVPLICQAISINFKIPVTEIGIAMIYFVFYLDFTKRNVSMDALTGLNNRRFLISDLFSLMKRRDAKQLALLMIDANDFKNINDKYGHLEGDKALKRISQALEESTYFLKHCSVSRYGGDEFTICFIERQTNDAKLIAYTITKNLEKINEEDNALIPVTISIGIAHYKDEYNQAEDFLKAADAALYEVKKEKNTWKNFN